MKHILALGSLLLTSNGFANLVFEDATSPELIVSPRALGMGNAFLAKVDDSSAPFYNPAGLGTVRYGHFHLSNVMLEANSDWIGQATSGNSSHIFENFHKGFKVDGSRKLLLKNRGELTHRKLQLAPNILTRYFSIGYMYSMETKAFLGKETTDLFQYSDRIDHGPYAAFNLSLYGGILKVGLSTVYLNRQEKFDEVDPNQKIDLHSSDYQEGSGFISTLGARITLPYKFLPTIAVVKHNAFGNGWDKVSGLGKPEKIKSTYDAGVSITPQIGRTMRIHMEVDIKDFTEEFKDVEMKNRIAGGMEIDFYRTFFIRAGYSAGYGAGGIGFRTRNLEFDLSTYAEDLVTYENGVKKHHDDRRYALGFSAGF